MAAILSQPQRVNITVCSINTMLDGQSVSDPYYFSHSNFFANMIGVILIKMGIQTRKIVITFSIPIY